MKATKLFSLAVAMTLIFGSCQKSDNPQTEIEMPQDQMLDVISVNADGVTMFNTSNVVPSFETTAELTSDEIEFLYAVREDEKLARDIYNSFYSLYASKPMSNIAKAEENHIAAVERLFYFYSINYPAVGEAGVFADATRQSYYNELISKGTTLLDAYKAAAYLEEKDIADYEAVLPSITNPNIKLVIEHLIKGSINHFKATLRQIDALGGEYQAAVLSQERYTEIVNSNFANGKRYAKKGTDGDTNRGNGKGVVKGSVNQDGTCTGTSNGAAPGKSNGKGVQGKGYRGGK